MNGAETTRELKQQKRKAETARGSEQQKAKAETTREPKQQKAKAETAREPKRQNTKRTDRKRRAAACLMAAALTFGIGTAALPRLTGVSLPVRPEQLRRETPPVGAGTEKTGEIQISAKGEADAAAPELHAQAAVLMDMDSGRVLYEKNGSDRLPMASTTKIMTCLVALENGNLDDMVEISPYAAGQPKVRLGMEAGERFLLRDLLYAMMLESHNDAAAAVAEHIGAASLSLPPAARRSREESLRAVAAFTALMNQKARDIGCFDTCFLTPNGLDAVLDEPGGGQKTHSTTARDLAAIMSYCVRRSGSREQFLEITETPSYSFTDAAGTRRCDCRNHNAFLQMMEGALSGKTGFTGAAGYCYVGALERDGKGLAVALLACGWPNHKTWKWSDTRALMEYGLERYAWYSFADLRLPEDWLEPVPVAGGRFGEDESQPPAALFFGNEPEATGEAETADGQETAGGQEKTNGQEATVGQDGAGSGFQAASVCLRTQTADGALPGVLLRGGETLTVSYRGAGALQAPVRAGDEVGRISYFAGKELLRTDLVVAVSDVEKIDFAWCARRVLERFFTFAKAGFGQIP